MAMSPQQEYLTDANGKYRTGVDILSSNQASASRDVDNVDKVKKLDKHSIIATSHLAQSTNVVKVARTDLLVLKMMIPF
jgi:hypothetical protein